MTILGATQEFDRVREAERAAHELRQTRARQLQELDDLIEAVELRNLEDQAAVPVSVFADIARCASEIGTPAPAAIWKTRTLGRLHERLLSWQGTVLDGLSRHRLDYADRFD